MIALFFDTETTGFKSKDFTPDIVQIGAIVQETDTKGIRGEMNWLVKPRHPIPEAATKVHGITDELVAKYGYLSGYAENAFIFLADMADMIVAHNIAFDLGIIKDVWPVAYEILKDKEQFCTMLNSTEICGLTGTHAGKNKHPKLKEAYKHFYGVEPDNQHDAMSDVRACRDVFFKLHELKALV